MATDRLEPFVLESVYRPFCWVEAMSKASKKLRSDAAKELRKSRNGGSTVEKADNRKRAAAYKALAANEEWLEGEAAQNSVTPGRPNR
jgi:hypothetical protein